MVNTLRYVFLCLLICQGVFAQCSKDLELKRTNKIIQKLSSLGNMRPAECMAEAGHMKIQRPELPKQEELRLSVLEMSFRVVSDLLMKNASTKWNSSELRQLQDFLRQQRQCYSECVPVVSTARAEVEIWRAFWSRLSDFLSEKSFSSCAWESARTFILRAMRSFHGSLKTRPTSC